MNLKRAVGKRELQVCRHLVGDRPGCAAMATSEGTARYRSGHPAAPGHYRDFHGLALSSLGLGTYLGRADDETDALYQDAVARAFALGINVIDSAISYRNQRSERAVGRALAGLPRDQVFVSTKGGFLAFDGARPHDIHAYIEEQYVRTGLLRRDEIADGCHALAPRFLLDQLGRSLRNLRLDFIDLYYVHNPETQLGEVARPEFLRRLRAAFEALERACAEGKIGGYGTATWSGYRAGAADPEHLSFAEVLAAARDVGGERHHFRAVQLPFNADMTEAAGLVNQGGRTLLQAAADAGVAVFASASLLQGRLPAAPSLQHVRGTRGILCALAGMKTRAHVEENAALAQIKVDSI
jgi:aryl-alcohol dehydrogenase-like predicted oxidoreductase